MYSELLKKTPYQDLSYLLFAFSISSTILKYISADPNAPADPIKTVFIILLIASVIGAFLGKIRPIERGLKKFFEWKKKHKYVPFSSPYIAEEKNKLIASIYFFLSILSVVYYNPLELTNIRIALTVLVLLMLIVSIYDSWKLPHKLRLLDRYYDLASRIDPQILITVRNALARKDWQEIEMQLRQLEGKYNSKSAAIF